MTELSVVDAAEQPARLKWYAAGAAAGVFLAVAVVVFTFIQFASASDLEHESVRVTAVEGRATQFESRATALEMQHIADQRERERLEEDYHFNRQQMWEIARTVGAKVLPAPDHK